MSRLTPCRDCGNLNSRSAVRCPKCGAKVGMSEGEKALAAFIVVPVGIGVALVVIVLLYAAFDAIRLQMGW